MDASRLNPTCGETWGFGISIATIGLDDPPLSITTTALALDAAGSGGPRAAVTVKLYVPPASVPPANCNCEPVSVLTTESHAELSQCQVKERGAPVGSVDPDASIVMPHFAEATVGAKIVGDGGR